MQRARRRRWNKSMLHLMLAQTQPTSLHGPLGPETTDTCMHAMHGGGGVPVDRALWHGSPVVVPVMPMLPTLGTGRCGAGLLA